MEEFTLTILAHGLTPQQVAVAAACCKVGPQAVSAATSEEK